MTTTKEPDFTGIKVPAAAATCRTPRPAMDVFDDINGGSGGVLGAMGAITGAQKLGLIGGEEPTALKYAGAVLMVAGGIVGGSCATAWATRKFAGFFEKDCQ